MSKPAKDPVREERIEDEAIVDAYGSEEKALGWYYYLESTRSFPFKACCIATKKTSPLRKGETAEVGRLAPEDDRVNDMLVVVKWKDRKIAVPLPNLSAVEPNESTEEATGATGARKVIFFSFRPSE